MTWPLPEPILTDTVRSPALPALSAAEPKWDGFRAALCVDGDQVVLRSRRGTQMAPAFPEIVTGAAQLPDATALDGELIVWNAGGHLAFEQLRNRLHRRGPSAVQAAAQQPAHFVAFDVLRLADTDTLTWPYSRRRTALEELFREHRLTAPWALCPSTTDPDTVHEWLTTWTTAGLEGVVFKRLDSP